MFYYESIMLILYLYTLNTNLNLNKNEGYATKLIYPGIFLSFIFFPKAFQSNKYQKANHSRITTNSAFKPIVYSHTFTLS